jgi:tetratricopeptide (TPR) repeat protein
MTAPGRELSASQATATGMLAAAELARGDLIAQRYRIEEMLGIGGMGVVYRAHDQQLDVPVALKLLRPELAARPDAFARFRQELLLARQVSSPHVVRIHDLVQHGGLWLISMDFVPGASLEKRLDRDGAMAEETALKIVRQVALGLTAAHDSGVVHRDLKPANILVTDGGDAFISDFGVARSAAQTGITGTGVVVGTPEYLSPEQARAETVDGRSDLYTLGLILYELISGRLPFHGSTAAESLAQRIVRSPPPLRKVKPDVAGWIDALCGRLLALKPPHRLPHARAVVEAIDKRRVAAPPGLWPRRAAIAGAALACLALAGWAWQRLATPGALAPMPALDLVVLPVLVPDDADPATQQLAEGLSTWLWGAFASSSQRSADPERMQVLLRQLDFDASSAARNSERVRDTLPSARLLGATLSQDAGEWRVRLAAPGDAPGSGIELVLPQAATAHWSGATMLPGVSPRDWPGSDALRSLAQAEDATATDEALAAFDHALQQAPGDGLVWRQALRHAERHRSPNQQATLAEAAQKALEGNTTHDAAAARAHAHLLLGAADAALREIDAAQAPSDLPLQRLRARAQAEQQGPEAALATLHEVVRQDPQDLRAWFLLGRYALLGGDARRAVDDYLVRALVIAQRIGDEWGAAEARNAMGIGYERLGQPQAAIENFTLAAATRERLGDVLGAANSLRNLAAAEAVRGDAVAAERSLERAGVLLRDVDAPLAQADLHNDRGLIAEERGDYRAALAAYRDALALRQAAGDATDVAESQYNVGFAYYQIGEFDNALVYWRQSEAEYAQRHDDAGRLRALQSLALIDSARGAWDEARRTLEAAVRDAESLQMTEEHAVGLVSLGELDRLQGRLGDAIVHADRAARLFAQREDRRGSIESELLRVVAQLDAGDHEAALGTLERMHIDDGASDEQRALHALRRAQAELARGALDAAAAALTNAGEAASAAHSQPAAIEVELANARLNQLRGERDGAQAALRRARSALERFAPLVLSLQSAETALRLGASDEYPQALALLRRAPAYGRAYAIHHAAAAAFAAAGDASEAEDAARRWRESLRAARELVPPDLRAGFDAQAVAQEPTP